MLRHPSEFGQLSKRLLDTARIGGCFCKELGIDRQYTQDRFRRLVIDVYIAGTCNTLPEPAMKKFIDGIISGENTTYST